MGLVSLTTIKPEVQDYVANGTPGNFVDPNGDKITGHIFTRQELYDALDKSATSEFFLASALSVFPGSSNKFLNVVLCKVENGAIDTNALYISSVDPMTSALTFNTNNTVNPDGVPVTAADFTEMWDNYMDDAEPKPLILASDDKVKGYNVSRAKIEALGLQDEPTAGNKDQTFAFIPMIRPVDSLTDKPYLTFALAEVDGAQVVGDIEDYVKPCPTMCVDYATTF